MLSVIHKRRHNFFEIFENTRNHVHFWHTPWAFPPIDDAIEGIHKQNRQDFANDPFLPHIEKNIGIRWTLSPDIVVYGCPLMQKSPFNSETLISPYWRQISLHKLQAAPDKETSRYFKN